VLSTLPTETRALINQVLKDQADAGGIS
jgi:hypothetical protein